MMHYRKAENVEEEITKDKLPFENLPNDFLWIHVKGGTKVHSVINYAKEALDKSEHHTIVWSGCGGGVGKTISCAEILKRSYTLHQITRLTYKTVEEHWLPQMEGLEEIVANRQIPCIHILLTVNEVDQSTNGLQLAGVKTPFWVERPVAEKDPRSSNQPGGSGRNRKDQGKQRYGNQNRNNGPPRPNKPQQQQSQSRKPKPPPAGDEMES